MPLRRVKGLLFHPDSSPSRARVPLLSHEAPLADLRRSVCPFDCPDACGMLVEVEGGRAVGVRGDFQQEAAFPAAVAALTAAALQVTGDRHDY